MKHLELITDHQKDLQDIIKSIKDLPYAKKQEILTAINVIGATDAGRKNFKRNSPPKGLDKKKVP